MRSSSARIDSMADVAKMPASVPTGPIGALAGDDGVDRPGDEIRDAGAEGKTSRSVATAAAVVIAAAAVVVLISSLTHLVVVAAMFDTDVSVVAADSAVAAGLEGVAARHAAAGAHVLAAKRNAAAAGAADRTREAPGIAAALV